MDQQPDLTAVYVDLAVNVVTAFELSAGVRVLHEANTHATRGAAFADRWRAIVRIYID